MAKRRGGTMAMTRSAPVVVMAPSAPRPRRMQRARHVARRVGHHARRGGALVARKAWEEKSAISAIGGAGLVGFLDGSGHLDFLPDFGIGRVPELAIGTYLAGRLLKKQQLRLAGIGLAAAAAFAFGQDKGGKKK
jgi:hypothetical protein